MYRNNVSAVDKLVINIMCKDSNNTAEFYTAMPKLIQNEPWSVTYGKTPFLSP
jgi:hypothetical protein